MKRNVFEDFKVMITLKNDNLKGCPFSFEYSVKGDPENSVYVANWAGLDNENNSHVFPVYDKQGNVNQKQFIIVFENHGLPCGQVVAKRRFTIADAHFEDGAQNRVYEELTEIELAEGVFESVGDINAVVGINLVKPVAGVDYNTEADKSAITEAVKAVVLSDFNAQIAALNKKIADLESKINSLQENMPSIEGLARVDELPDMTEYTKTADMPDFAEFAKKADLPDFAEFAKKGDVPSIEGLATAESVSGLDARVTALEQAKDSE